MYLLQAKISITRRKKNVLPPLTFRFFQANLKKQHKSRKIGNKKTHLRIYASRCNVLPEFSGSKVYKGSSPSCKNFTKLMKVEGTHQQMHHFTHHLAEHINNCKERSEQEDPQCCQQHKLTGSLVKTRRVILSCSIALSATSYSVTLSILVSGTPKLPLLVTCHWNIAKGISTRKTTSASLLRSPSWEDDVRTNYRQRSDLHPQGKLHQIQKLQHEKSLAKTKIL